MGNSYGHTFRLSSWGESHGAGIGVVVDGCPPRLPLTVEDIQHDLDRRRPGQSRLTTQRGEADSAEILSGVFDGLTTGGPIAVLVRNADGSHNPDEKMAMADFEQGVQVLAATMVELAGS
mgnify:CR=1 FL=1